MSVGDEESVHYADELDRAAAIADAINTEGVDKSREFMKPQQERDENGEWPIKECVDCDDELPVERLNLARIRCVTCQEKLEKRNGNVRR